MNCFFLSFPSPTSFALVTRSGIGELTFLNIQLPPGVVLDSPISYPSDGKYQRIVNNSNCKTIVLKEASPGQRDVSLSNEQANGRPGIADKNERAPKENQCVTVGKQGPKGPHPLNEHQRSFDPRNKIVNFGASTSSGKRGNDTEVVRTLKKKRKELDPISPISDENNQNILNGVSVTEIWDTDREFDDDGCGEVTQADIDAFIFENKRKFYYLVGREEILRVKLDFIRQDRRVLNVKVSRMHQSKRFWLAVKFCRNVKKTGFKHDIVCEIFGVQKSMILPFCHSKLKDVSYLDYGFLSPYEYDKKYKHAPAYICENASNLKSMLATKTIQIKKSILKKYAGPDFEF